jgi:hypothetical protein
MNSQISQGPGISSTKPAEDPAVESGHCSDWSLSNLTGRERKLASRGGGWARSSQAEKKVDKRKQIVIMGYYEN